MPHGRQEGVPGVWLRRYLRPVDLVRLVSLSFFVAFVGLKVGGVVVQMKIQRVIK